MAERGSRLGRGFACAPQAFGGAARPLPGAIAHAATLAVHVVCGAVGRRVDIVGILALREAGVPVPPQTGIEQPAEAETGESHRTRMLQELGRASGRERVGQYV